MISYGTAKNESLQFLIIYKNGCCYV